MKKKELKSLLKEQQKKIVELIKVNENLNQTVKELQQEKNIKTLSEIKE